MRTETVSNKIGFSNLKNSKQFLFSLLNKLLIKRIPLLIEIKLFPAYAFILLTEFLTGKKLNDKSLENAAILIFPQSSPQQSSVKIPFKSL